MCKWNHVRFLNDTVGKVCRISMYRFWTRCVWDAEATCCVSEKTCSQFVEKACSQEVRPSTSQIWAAWRWSVDLEANLEKTREVCGIQIAVSNNSRHGSDTIHLKGYCRECTRCTPPFLVLSMLKSVLLLTCMLSSPSLFLINIHPYETTSII